MLVPKSIVENTWHPDVDTRLPPCIEEMKSSDQTAFIQHFDLKPKSTKRVYKSPFGKNTPEDVRTSKDEPNDLLDF